MDLLGMVQCSGCIEDWRALVEYLIAKGTDINWRNAQGQTPLFEAAKDGDSKLVQLLIDNGATVNVADTEGNTPLHFAVTYGYEVAKPLILHGADVNARNRLGESPLSRAKALLHPTLIHYKGQQLIGLLQQQGATE